MSTNNVDGPALGLIKLLDESELWHREITLVSKNVLSKPEISHMHGKSQESTLT